MNAFFAAFSDFDSILEDQIATDTHVVARWRCKGIHSGDLVGLPASGKALDFMGVSMWEFVDGKAIKGWMCSDTAAMLAQMQATEDA